MRSAAAKRNVGKKLGDGGLQAFHTRYPTAPGRQSHEDLEHPRTFKTVTLYSGSRRHLAGRRRPSPWMDQRRRVDLDLFCMLS